MSGPTGAELARAVREAARGKGVLPATFARPLSKDPGAYLRTLECATKPTAVTIARIAALIAGKPVLPAKRTKPSGPRVVSAARASGVRPEADPPVREQQRVYRDPCGFCGVRGDIGCVHQAAGQGAVRWAA